MKLPTHITIPTHSSLIIPIRSLLSYSYPEYPSLYMYSYPPSRQATTRVEREVYKTPVKKAATSKSSQKQYWQPE